MSCRRRWRGPTRRILCYPQFWTWRLSGRAVGEISYLGCHSHVWAPLAEDYSSLVDARGWRAKNAPARPRRRRRRNARSAPRRRVVADGRRAQRRPRQQRLALFLPGARLPRLHDGFDRHLGHRDEPDCPLDALDETRDMLANVAVDGGGVATARFMGGREFDVISGGLKPADRSRASGGARRREVRAALLRLRGILPGAEGRIVGDVRATTSAPPWRSSTSS